MNILFLNQCFYPDVVSTAQHLTDLAVELSNAGHKVTVLASNRGYDNPALSFSGSELWNGINIQRVPVPGMGKRAKWRRALDFAGFFLSSLARLALLPKHDLVVGMTSPPLIAALGALFVRIKGGKFLVWVMDLNPDEAIAAGVLRQESVIGRTLAKISEYSMQRANSVVVLDRFMKQRIVDKGITREKISVVPPWSHEDAVGFDQVGRNQFRVDHGLEDKFVVMYSGNHSPCHPLDTLLQAALHLCDDDEIVFCFVGGGSEFTRVKRFQQEHGLKNILCLPYQPLERVSGSLSAADMHVVVMGNQYVGIKHPCKIYNIICLSTQFLFIGPEECHVSDLCSKGELSQVARMAAHGDVSTVIKHITAALKQSPIPRLVPPISVDFSKAKLVPKLISIMEST